MLYTDSEPRFLTVMWIRIGAVIMNPADCVYFFPIRKNCFDLGSQIRYASRVAAVGYRLHISRSSVPGSDLSKRHL